MTSLDSRIRHLLGPAPASYWQEKSPVQYGYWGERALSQLVFAYELTKLNKRAAHELEDAVSFVEGKLRDEGVIGKQTALQIESMLDGFRTEAKQYDILCVSHAHIDMNWMWSWDETVAVTLDTLRTMLNLMDEYPDFTFSQSQASVYHIVEKYDPPMLEEIKRRVKEGRWEVTASHWVEADKNMPSGESLTRHLLYTRRYLSDLLDLDPDSLNFDFEPDTFGHSVNVPEILASGGIRYYYHCRGNDAPVLYRWEAPSGRSVIVYREPTWYNDTIQSVLGSYVPDICRQTGLNTYLNVYGVGDHGGGPTRRDLERLLDMKNWPVYPNIRFGTYREYFALAETIADRLPVLKGEQNFVFTGCYTSQTRIKTANRVGEAALGEAETFGAAAAAAAGANFPGPGLEEAWRNVLFNQFHDILPGSGVIATREHALGLFQNSMAIAQTNLKRALERIAEKIDTSSLAGTADEWSSSEGAGVGFGASDFKITQVERGRGNKRIVHVFNSSAYDREEAVEIVLWDWKSPISALAVADAAGQAVPHQTLDAGRHPYWGHDYIRLLAYVRAPACGYATYTVTEGEESVAPLYSDEPRKDSAEDFTLENDMLKVTFDPLNASIRSMISKPTGEELIDPSRPAGLFRLIREDPAKGMTAWWIGRYLETRDLHQGVKIKKGAAGEVRQSLSYEILFGASKLNVTVSLDRGASRLDYQAQCDWQEVGSAAAGIPQLNFLWPLSYECGSYRYDVPFGTLEREPLDMDVPANSFAAGVPKDKGQSSIMLVTNNKYGFRGTDDALAVSLIRSSFDPDPYPELGNHHRFAFGIHVMDPADPSAGTRIEKSFRFHHPLHVLSGTAHPGSRPLADSFFKVMRGSVAVSSVKMPEAGNGNAWIIRVYETEGRHANVELQVFKPAADARFVDAHERILPDEGTVTIAGRSVSFGVRPYAVAAILVSFAD